MIELHNVVKKFDGRGIAGINGVNLELGPGEVLAVMGPNGSGKTTLINIAADMIKPDQGRVKREGETVIFSGMPYASDLNVQKYLIQQNSQEIDEEKKLQLARDFADIFEFTFQLRQNLSQLSAGQKQKVALASLLINRPSLILLDEPFTHLDPHTRKDILSSLFKYIRNQEISLLWVTHDLDEALKFSDRVGILNFGKFEQIDTPLKLIERPKNLFVAQFLGYENFFPVKKVDGEWLTPWGLLNHEGDKLHSDEALLVIPSRAWEVSAGNEALVTGHSIKGYDKAFTAVLKDKEVQVTIDRSKVLTQIGSRINLKPNLTNCFLIPL